MFLSAICPRLQPDKEWNSQGVEQMERAIEGDEENLSGPRSRKRISELACCPVCSCTLRPGELQSHLALELERLAKLTGPVSKRRAQASPGPAPAPPHNGAEPSDCTGNDVYQRVKKNREKRLRSNRGRNEVVTCPVCNRRLTTAEAEVHVDACLRKSTPNEDDDESIDVEGDDVPEEEGDENRFGVSYEWCSQVRVRASALQLMDGGELPHGAMRIRRASTDTHLVVDADDDDLLFGPPQYSPSRIIPQNHDSPTENSESTNNMEVTPGDIDVEFRHDDIAQVKNDTDDDSNPIVGYNIVVEALKSRIRELELQLSSKNKRSETKCLICIGPYIEPVVSVQCWHVYCEGCWLASLSAKKTCPQCNTITTSQHLRRIYL